MNTDRWYYRIFQSASDLIHSLLPGSAEGGTGLGLDPTAPGDQLYLYNGLEIKELSHRLDGLCKRFLQQQPQVEHWAVLVIKPHNRLKLGPTQALRLFLEQQVVWLNLEELSQESNLDPLLNLLTLPVRPEAELSTSSRQILASRPDLKTVVLPMLAQRRSPSHPPPTQPPLRPIERRHHRLDPGPAAGATGSLGRRHARLQEPGRPAVLAGRQHLNRQSPQPERIPGATAPHQHLAPSSSSRVSAAVASSWWATAQPSSECASSRSVYGGDRLLPFIERQPWTWPRCSWHERARPAS